MLALSCFHDTNASISSSICDANHIEETEESLGQDKVLNGAQVFLHHLLLRFVGIMP
jgi:hypothetical protein